MHSILTSRAKPKGDMGSLMWGDTGIKATSHPRPTVSSELSYQNPYPIYGNDIACVWGAGVRSHCGGLRGISDQR